MKNNITHISETELDNLLKQAFLEVDFNDPVNGRMLETIVRKNMTGGFLPYQVLRVLTLKSFIASILFIVVLSAAVVLYNSKKDVIVMKTTSAPAPMAAPANTLKKEMVPSPVPPAKPENPENQSAQSFVGDEGLLPLLSELPVEENMSPTENSWADMGSGKPTMPDEYLFPTLTEKETKANEKEKKRMAKLAAKLQKDYYSPIRNGKEPAMYYMRTCEVTNLEYRTFLFDLLIQGKKDDFLKAKPNQDMWLGAAGRHNFDYLAKEYFSDKKYNDHPVVNITSAGAEMYSAWLTELVAGHEDNGGRKIEFRIPEESQWIRAANVGVANAVYPWFNDSIQNKYNLFLANFCFQKLQDKFNRPIVYPKRYKVNKNAYTTAGYVLGDTAIATILVYCYNPNDHMLYAMCGNVSEMVFIDGTQDIKTKGGNWSSDFEHLKLNSDDEFPMNPKPSPMIGFRVCALIK